MKEYQDSKALKNKKPTLNTKMSETNGETIIKPSPIIWKAVLYLPNKSDLVSSIFFDLEIINNLR